MAIGILNGEMIGTPNDATMVNYTNTDGSKTSVQHEIEELKNQMQSFEETKSEIVDSALGQALGMSTEDKWENVVFDIEGVANNGTLNKTFTPSTSAQTYTIPKGYTSGGTVKCNAVSTSTASSMINSMIKSVTITATGATSASTNSLHSNEWWASTDDISAGSASALTFSYGVTANQVLGIVGTHETYSHWGFIWSIAKPNLVISTVGAIDAASRYGVANVGTSSATLYLQASSAGRPFTVTVYYV